MNDKTLPNPSSCRFDAPSPYRLLNLQTSRVPVTDMTEYQKFQTILGVILGSPPVKGWFRPRDLPFNRDSVDFLEFAQRMNRSVFDLESPLSCWAESISVMDEDFADNRTEEGRKLCILSDFTTNLGLALMAMNQDTGARTQEEDSRRRCRMASTVLLEMLRKIDSSDEWEREIGRCFIDLELDKKKCREDLSSDKKRYREAREFIESVARCEWSSKKFKVHAVKLNNINNGFLSRWDSATMKRGASALVYSAIAILRERIVRELGPVCVIHDFAGWLYLTLPEEYSFTEKWIEQAFIQSFEPGGWLREQFPRAIRFDDLDDSQKIACFPGFSLLGGSSSMTLNELQDWKLPGVPRGDANSEGNSEAIKSGALPDPLCEQCKQYQAVGAPHRWMNKKSGTQQCPVCLLISDGLSPWIRHQFMDSVVKYFHENCPDILVSFHLDAGKNTTDENGKTTFLCVDGNAVGDFIHKSSGIHELRRNSMRIDRDLHDRLRAGIGNLIKDLKHDEHLGVELQWIGGDDLMIRCHPRHGAIIQDAFETESFLSYATGLVECEPNDKGLIKGMEEAKGKMKECKKAMKAASTEDH